MKRALLHIRRYGPLLSLSLLLQALMGNAACHQDADTDGDGYPQSIDCNDLDPNAYPGAPERCDGIDNNCDGIVDESPDADADGYAQCGSPTAPGDCNDQDPAINPGAPELCDGRDNDCDGLADEASDADGDGFSSCDSETGPADCNDADPSVNPRAPERCDGVDNNCDGIVDDTIDADGDGLSTCEGDCDDADASVSPFAEEVCDGIDNNCDGLVDDAASASLWSLDRDGDGYGDPDATEQACSAPRGYVPNGEDCDDWNSSVSPGAEEVCGDGIDNDCDGISAECLVTPGSIPGR